MLKSSLPNLFTIGNLTLGIISIIFAFNAQAVWAAMMVIVAMLLDGVDGRVARALNVQSEFGKELDSLSDVISFGVAPAFIMYEVGFQHLHALGWIVTALFPICGALRLARFNVDGAGTPGYFIGLPIPAAGGVLSTFALFHKEMPTAVLFISTVALSFLMISRVKYPNFKKVAIPKAALWIVPALVLCAVALSIYDKGMLSRFIFVPLLLYALYGLKKNVRLVFRLLRRKIKKAAANDGLIEREQL